MQDLTWNLVRPRHRCAPVPTFASDRQSRGTYPSPPLDVPARRCQTRLIDSFAESSQSAALSGSENSMIDAPLPLHEADVA